MDVTFNNVLEGARQYFQGLPTATPSATNPTYQIGAEHQIPHYGAQKQERPPNSSTVPYWQAHSESQLRPQAHDSSHHPEAETARLPTQNQNISQLQELHSTPTRYLQEQQPHSYQYNQQQPQHVSQYQSHIVSNPSYHQASASHQVQTASPRVHEQPVSQAYHQTEPTYTNYQQARSYYPVHSQPQQQQPQTYHQSYQTAPAQTYSQTSYANQTYNTHSQNLYTSENNYTTLKVPAAQHSQEANKDKPTSQPYRTTHNLPPIAALSNINYHSSRSRDVIRSAATKSRSVIPTASTSSYPTKSVTETAIPQHPSRLPTHYADYINSAQQTRPAVQYNNSTPVSQPNNNSQYNITVSTTHAVHHQSSNSTSYSTSYQPQQEVKSYQPLSSVTNHNVIHQTPNSGVTSVIKQKRETPLDLSVKTVRTPADSTLNDSEELRLSKYYQGIRQSIHVPVTYSSYGHYSNNLQRNHTMKATSGAPKVDFLPNFNMPSLVPSNKGDSRRAYEQNRQASYHQRLSNTAPISAHGSNNPLLASTLSNNSAGPNSASLPTHSSSSVLHKLSNNAIMQASVKKPVQGLPRIDFLPPPKPSLGPSFPSEVKKRNGDNIPQVVPSKIQKVDMWRQTIDQQIEQKLSSYTKSRLQVEQPQKQVTPKLANGNMGSGVDRNTYQRPPYTPQAHTYNNTQTNHNQTYVPTPVVAHQYPSYANHGSQAFYSQHSMQRTNSNPCLSSSNRSNIGGAADRRVLSLLRNSLEIKGAKEARKKLEQEQQQIPNHPRTDIQQPSTDVMAPLQPKSGLVGRHNMSPFAATSLYEQNISTAASYKFHLPKAIDSIKLEGEDSKDTPIPEKTLKNLDETSINNSNADLDGLAAFLAARIRTKAELKQVSTTQNTCTTELTRSVSESQLSKALPQAAEFLVQDLKNDQPRRKLFTKNEGDVRTTPLRDKTGLRSSSETSVFDFPDSDSETEMPVLERQSLVNMRKDRKTVPKSVPNDEMPVIERKDISFDSACDSFMEQLKASVVKKRGRRKKVFEPEILAKLESVAKDVDIKTEFKEEPKDEVVNSESDSDEPLINCRVAKEVKREIIINSDVESDEDTKKEVPEKVIEEPRVKPDTMKKTPSGKPFGDGSDFYPGWEEAVYNYKRSLRMPAALIHVTRPPHWHRLSTSLPDLDAHSVSPSPSETTDNTKPKLEPELDSEIDTNSNVSSFSLGKNHCKLEESPIPKSIAESTPKPKSTSIIARLIERCGTLKRRKVKKKQVDESNEVQKPTNPLELLSTPSLEVQTLQKGAKTSKIIIKEEPTILGFRKKTIDNFKDTFTNNSNTLLGINEQFKTVVMKSRTRLENKTLKQKPTIKEVFGDDRPASAPPVLPDAFCLKNTEQIKDELDHIDDTTSQTDIVKNKFLELSGDRSSLLKAITAKKMISECMDDNFIRKDAYKSETPSIDGDDYVTPAKKRMKSIRRKFSSGFDYIRKKKKLIKKEDSEQSTKPKRRGLTPKANPESIQDIQKEIKMWVLNKGTGETHLHRAARCGYTDITAYCLEKMEGTASPKDNAGYTPLHEACSKGHLGIAKLLLLYGANVSESAQGGIRPLHEAAENGYVEIVRLLLSYGADPLLATYSGLTPLSLATEETTVQLLQNHIADIQGHPSAVWTFLGPATCFDLEDSGYNPLETLPMSDHSSEEDDFEFELSNIMLPNLYTIRGESQSEHWILLQDLSHILKIKSRDTLLKQICPVTIPNSTNMNYKSVLRELKMSDFLEQASCSQYLSAGEKINTRASKVALVKYSDKVRQLLSVEKCMITVR